VGAIIRRERLAHGWSQRELSRRCGWGPSQVSRMEAGVRRPTETATRVLAKVLRAGRPPVEVAELDVELQRAAGPSLRRWCRRPPSPARMALYAEAAARLDAARTPDPAALLGLGRLLAALSPAGGPR
jgi:transcriptional regulator with XRE-family HTH domain